TVSSSRINLAWTDNAFNETAFKVERSTDGVTFALIATLNANTTAYADGNLAASTQFYYRVIATDGANDSPPSNVASATTLRPPTSWPAPSRPAASTSSGRTTPPTRPGSRSSGPPAAGPSPSWPSPGPTPRATRTRACSRAPPTATA